MEAVSSAHRVTSGREVRLLCTACTISHDQIPKNILQHIQGPGLLEQYVTAFGRDALHRAIHCDFGLGPVLVPRLSVRSSVSPPAPIVSWCARFIHLGTSHPVTDSIHHVVRHCCMRAAESSPLSPRRNPLSFLSTPSIRPLWTDCWGSEAEERLCICHGLDLR